MSARPARKYTCVWIILSAAIVFAALALVPWHDDIRVRRATGIVLIALILWITEVMPLGVTGLLIPIGATFAGVLTWPEALAAWSDPILFLFLGAFLLARGLEKHGAFDFLIHARWTQRFRGGHGAALALVVLLVAGVLSSVQSNTAVAAMMLPAVVALARTVRSPTIVLLALSYGATFGGMATPVGTPPNFIGYAAMKKLDTGVSFLSWMRVGVPVWMGTTLLTWGLLSLTKRLGVTLVTTGAPPAPADAPAVAPDGTQSGHARSAAARRWAVAAFAITVAIWLGTGLVVSLTQADDPVQKWVLRYLPESLAPLLAAGLLFLVRVYPAREPVLDRRDLLALDWDTLYLIAGGLCLGKMLQSSGAAAALAAAASHVQISPLLAMLALGGATVLLSELTSNTATAALMVPIAASLAPAVGLAPMQTIWLVALCASLGFALPVSTPPNAIVYGTRLVPLKAMVPLGIAVDIMSLIWVVLCMRWLA